MNVTLVTYTPDPDRLCAQCALVSKWKKGYTEFISDWNDETDMVHLTDALKRGHVSVVEHACFTLSLEGVSRGLTHQLVRHRLASYTQQSQRYVKYDFPDTITYDELEDTFVVPSIDNPQGQQLLDSALMQCIFVYKNLVEHGTKPEDARSILPNATKTNIMVTMNARELLHFFNLRCCYRAQREIRKVAWKMLKLVKKVAPIIFQNAGPSCAKLGYCPEKIDNCPFFNPGNSEEE